MDLVHSLLNVKNLVKISTATTVGFAIPFYILILTVLYKRRKVEPLNSTFFRIVSILGVVDVIYISHMYGLIKFPYFGFFYSFYTNVMNFQHGIKWLFWPNYTFFVVISFGLCQNFGITMTSLNRFTVLAFVMQPNYEDKVQINCVDSCWFFKNCFL